MSSSTRPLTDVDTMFIHILDHFGMIIVGVVIAIMLILNLIATFVSVHWLFS